MESHGKLEKSQRKVTRKSGNSVFKIWLTPCHNVYQSKLQYFNAIGGKIDGAFLSNMFVIFQTESFPLKSKRIFQLYWKGIDLTSEIIQFNIYAIFYTSDIGDQDVVFSRIDNIGTYIKDTSEDE